MDDQRIKVSVICYAFNHEKFIRKCIEGIVNQKTDFKFELVIHDDASVDKTSEIIEEYKNIYPEIIAPIYEKENQYSKGVSISSDIVFPKARGRYFAFCEGDDYWTDNNKLQEQFEYMESHPKCSMCVHNTVIHDLTGKDEDGLFSDYTKTVNLSPKDIIMGWSVHTSSYFMKREIAYKPEYGRIWCGDYVMLTQAMAKGDVAYIPKIYSVYNYNNKNGVTYKKRNSYYEAEKQRMEYLRAFDRDTNGKYHELIFERINNWEYRTWLLSSKEKLSGCKNIKEFKKMSKEVYTDIPAGNKNIGIVRRIRTFLLFRSYIVFKAKQAFNR